MGDFAAAFRQALRTRLDTRVGRSELREVISRLSCPYGASLFFGEIGIDGRLYAGVEVFGGNGLF